jgi:hypothetical protein
MSSWSFPFMFHNIPEEPPTLVSSDDPILEPTVGDITQGGWCLFFARQPSDQVHSF